ncbi:MAG: hypothetical protein Q8M58_01055, partial [Anaerolineales bacterium]|nr:hypothetical protein [Anaerolineales bacterium]
IPEENIVVVENGQVVELAEGKLSLAERVPGGYVFVEGQSIGEIGKDVMREREQLSRSGILLITATLDKYSNRLLKEPEIITRGFVSSEDAETMIPVVRKKVTDIINSGLDSEKAIGEAVRTLLYNESKRRPMVFVTLSKA